MTYSSYFLFLLAWFVHFARRGKGPISSIFFFGILVLGVEVVCFFLLGMPNKELKEFNVVDAGPVHIGVQMGNVPFADSVIHKLLVVEGDTAFDVHFSIDEFSKRITPGHNDEKDKHALFFGCSIAFGEGLEDNETLPYNFQEASEEYNSYNFAYSGYGANQMLARLEYQDLSEQVVEKDGVAFYVFFWDHLYRTIGAMSRYINWAHASPNYEMDGDKLVRDGSFKTGKFSSKMYEAIYQTSIVKYFDLDFPLSIKDKHYELLCEVIQQSKSTYEEQFGDTEFYVLLYPSYLPEEGWDFEKFKRMLDERNILYIDHFDLVDYGPQHTFVGDAHPNATTSELMGDTLYGHLQTLNEK